MRATKSFMHSTKSGATTRRSTKPDVSHLSRTDLPVRDDAGSNGGSRTRQEAKEDTGYPDWQEEHAGDDYYEGEYDEGDGMHDEDGELEDDSSEAPEPPTPKGKAKRPKVKGKGKNGSPDEGNGKGKAEPQTDPWPPVHEALAKPLTVPEGDYFRLPGRIELR